MLLPDLLWLQEGSPPSGNTLRRFKVAGVMYYTTLHCNSQHSFLFLLIYRVQDQKFFKKLKISLKKLLVINSLPG